MVVVILLTFVQFRFIERQGALLMVENRPFLTFAQPRSSLILGVVIIAFPVWMTFVASTHDQATMLRSPVPLCPARTCSRTTRRS